MIPADEEEFKISTEGIDVPRRPDRAKVWTLSRAEVVNMLSEEEESMLSEVDDFVHFLPYGLRVMILPRITRLLHETYPNTDRDYPKRGDMVYIENEDGVDVYDIEKYFYDGSNVVMPDMNQGVVTAPSTMQVIIEFPIQYWDGRFAGIYAVSFNINRYFPDIGINDIKTDRLLPYFRFTLEDEEKEVFTIYPNTYMYEDEIISVADVEAFLSWLTHTTQEFTTLHARERTDTKRYDSFYDSLDPEHTLILERPL